MFHAILRILGFLALAAGLFAGIIDGARSIADQSLDMMSLGGALSVLAPRLVTNLEPMLSQNLHPLLWDPVVLNLLLLPTVVVMFGLGLLLLITGRQRRIPITAPQ